MNKKVDHRNIVLSEEEKRNREKAMVRFVISYSKERGYPPSMREIAKELGIASSSTVWKFMHQCNDKGLIEMDPGVFRGLRVLEEGKKLASSR